MSGRGRGRGGRGGFAPATGGQMFLRRSAEECGLDARNLRALAEITRPSLYPEIEFSYGAPSSEAAAGDDANSKKRKAPVAPPVSKTDVFLISKMRELHHRIYHSMFNIQATNEVPDVIRYADLKDKDQAKTLSAKPKFHSDSEYIPVNISLIENACLSGKLQTAQGRFVPHELTISSHVSFNKRLKVMEAELLQAAMDADGPRGRSDSIVSATGPAKESNPGDAAGGGEDDEYEEEDPGDDEIEDYLVNHYASDEDNYGEDDDGEGEPTY